MRRLLLDLSIAAAVNILLFLLAALLLWPMGKARLAGQLAGGFGLFALVLALTFWAGMLLQRLFRIESGPPSNAFVIMNLVVSGALQVGWSAYAALAAGRFAPGTSFGVVAALHAVGFLSSFLAGVLVGAFYQGQLYKLVNALLAVVAYVLFAVFGSP